MFPLYWNQSTGWKCKSRECFYNEFVQKKIEENEKEVHFDEKW